MDFNSTCELHIDQDCQLRACDSAVRYIATKPATTTRLWRPQVKKYIYIKLIVVNILGIAVMGVVVLQLNLRVLH